MGNQIKKAMENAKEFCVAEKRFGKWEQRTSLDIQGEAKNAFQRMKKRDKYAVYKVIHKSEIGTAA